MILKILGIVIAAVLGIVLVLLLMALFIPVRYVVYVNKKDEMLGKGCFYWLFHILHVKVLFENNEVKYCFRIFGIPIMRTDKPKKSKEKKTSEKKTSEKKTSEKKTSGIREKKETVQQQGSAKVEEDSNQTTKSELHSEIEPERGTEEPEKKQSFIKRIKKKIKDTIQSVKKFFKNMMRVLKNFRTRKDKILEFLKDEQHKSALKKSKDSLIGLLKYAGPQKVKGTVVYGTGDPCSTGMSLGAASILYARYGENIKIRPDFENKVFEAELTARGRVRLIRFLYVLLKLYLDKDFKTFMDHGKKLKEEF